MRGSRGTNRRVDGLTASKSPNTLRAYRAALRQFDGWLGERPECDAALAEYLGRMDADGKAPATAAVAAAVRFRAEAQGNPNPAGKLARAAPQGAAGAAEKRGVKPVMHMVVGVSPEWLGDGVHDPASPRVRRLLELSDPRSISGNNRCFAHSAQESWSA